MATYTSVVRSNYFIVKDREAFQAWLDRFEDVEHIEDTTPDGTKLDGFLIDSGCGIPDYYYTDDYETEDEEEVDFLGVLVTHLTKGEVAVIIELGQEGMRYLGGMAWAINSEGVTKEINLSDSIYKEAKTIGNLRSYAEY